MYQSTFRGSRRPSPSLGPPRARRTDVRRRRGARGGEARGAAVAGRAACPPPPAARRRPRPPAGMMLQSRPATTSRRQAARSAARPAPASARIGRRAQAGSAPIALPEPGQPRDEPVQAWRADTPRSRDRPEHRAVRDGVPAGRQQPCPPAAADRLVQQRRHGHPGLHLAGAQRPQRGARRQLHPPARPAGCSPARLQHAAPAGRCGTSRPAAPPGAPCRAAFTDRDRGARRHHDPAVGRPRRRGRDVLHVHPRGLRQDRRRRARAAHVDRTPSPSMPGAVTPFGVRHERHVQPRERAVPMLGIQCLASQCLASQCLASQCLASGAPESECPARNRCRLFGWTPTRSGTATPLVGGVFPPGARSTFS